ncbi:hypothetical protein DFJ43DRAFT_1040729 [Lentinula guzmanii]|uniref:beta-glucosidase n=1 Tax=Lentinula guzmanii TaxID=2804957 RepID=A0AA38MZ94_9AGAR|nr:hypothetical protein DFJ43DRAFT_1040729 [Lentinula guzmanii]
MFVLILEEFSLALRYHSCRQLGLRSNDTLEKAAEPIQRSLLSSDLQFFELEQPMQFSNVKDLADKCRDLSDYDALNERAIVLSPSSTIGELLARSPHVTSKQIVIVVISRQAIASVAQKRPPPSTGAKSTQLISSQVEERPDAAYNHRPPELAPPPLSIYHPVFARFRREMATSTESLQFSVKELRQASLLMDVSLRHYSSEEQRREALRKVFFLDEQPFWDGTSININDTEMDLDGVLKLDLGFGFGLVYTTLGELKNGGGDGGCDPSDQAQCAYIKLVSSKQYQPVREASCCPVLLLGLSGHVLAVWGAVFADRFFFERLALIYIGPQPPSTLPSSTMGRSDIEVGIREAAKLFRTLEHCVQDVKYHYCSLDLPAHSSPVSSTTHSTLIPKPFTARTSRKMDTLPSTISTPLDPSRFVYWNSFTSQGKQYKLGYCRRLTEYMTKPVFVASLTSSSDLNFPVTEVVVKFALRYSEVGHRLLADVKLAPRIHYCSFEKSIGLWVIVMDYIQGNVCNRKLTKPQKDSLADAIGILHKNNFVFGDLREPNVIITEGENQTTTLPQLQIDYRAFDARNITPRYEFGFGLSYTEFKYSGLNIVAVNESDNAQADLIRNWEAGHPSPIGLGSSTALWQVTFEVQNTGDVSGGEIPQLYLQMPPSSDEPPSVLKGFSDVFLQPGETKTITVMLSRHSLSIWDVVAQGWRRPKVQRQWLSEQAAEILG